MNLHSSSRRASLALLVVTAVAGCGDDSETGAQAGPPSEELITACVDYLTQLDGFAEANGCTRIDAAAQCDLYHPDATCEAEVIAEYTCLAAAATAEDCQCEAEGGGVLCNEALGACEAEGDASLECFNRGG